MTKDKDSLVCSKAAPEKITEDLQPLVDFTNEGLPLKQLSEMIKKRLVPHLLRYDHPGFQSMFNAFPEKGAEFGAGIALSYNQGVTNWQVSPGGVVLEELCCKALCQLIGLPSTADATFMYSGTYGNQEALYLALHKKAEQEGFDLAKKGMKGFTEPDKLTILTSSQAHFSIKHAARMLGLGEESIIPLNVDDNYRIDVKAMKKKIEELQQTKDLFYIFITAGTTSTGSIDPIEPIAEIAREIGAWLHVDGAYGFAYSLVPEWRELFKGFEQADSLCWNPHKQLGIPIPNSLLFVRDWEEFGRMTVYSDYFNRREDPEPNPGLKSPPSTRPFSALPLVTSLRYQGMRRVVNRLKKPLVAIKRLYEQLQKEEDIEVMHKPDTGILCFRIKPQGVANEKMDELQRYCYDKIMAARERTISLTKLKDKSVLRVVAISPAVTFEALMETIADVRQYAREFRENK